ncbi:MAG: type II toxin-antitoxin system VapC family toxin [bacterium]
MRILIDTCVLAEIRKPDGHPAVKSAVAQIDDKNLFLSVITIGEIAKGVRLLPSGNKKQALVNWLNTLEVDYKDRILPVDSEIARIWGELTADAQSRGVIIPAMDGLIAATALRHGLHIMTRNVRHFQLSRDFVIDPWTD